MEALVVKTALIQAKPVRKVLVGSRQRQSAGVDVIAAGAANLNCYEPKFAGLEGNLKQDHHKQTIEETEVIISVPLKVLEELNYYSGGKLSQESEPSHSLGLSAAAIGRSDKITCSRDAARSDFQVVVVKH